MSVTPPPSALEPTAPPPWPEPEGLIKYDDDPHYGMGCGFFMGALVPLALAFFSRVQSRPRYDIVYGGLIVAAVLLLVGWRKMARSKAGLPERRARHERSVRSWARVKSSTVSSQNHGEQGIVKSYVLALELEVWTVPPAGPAHRTAPTSARRRRCLRGSRRRWCRGRSLAWPMIPWKIQRSRSRCSPATAHTSRSSAAHPNARALSHRCRLPCRASLGMLAPPRM